MAKIDLTEAQKAQIDGQNSAVDAWPSDLAARQNLIRGYLAAREAERIELKRLQDEAKKKSDVAGKLDNLTKVYGWERKAIDTIVALKKITDPEKLARTARQIYEGMKDEGMLIPELFDPDRMGLHEGKADEATDKPVFDNTPKGSQTAGLGGASKPKTDTAPAPKPTPAVDLRIVEAELHLNNYLAANPYKQGAKKTEHKRLLAAVEDARALAASDPGGDKRNEGSVPADLTTPADTGATTAEGKDPVPPPELPEVNPNPPNDAELPELPAAGNGEVSKEIAAGTAASTAHVEAQIEGTLPVKPKRMTAAAKKKAAEAEANAAKEAAAQAGGDTPVEGPDGPEDDEPAEEAPFAALPPATRRKPAPIGGTASASTRLG